MNGAVIAEIGGIWALVIAWVCIVIGAVAFAFLIASFFGKGT